MSEAPDRLRHTFDPSDVGPGIDVGKYHEDIRRIFYRRFSQRVIAAGHDPEDVLQRVFVGILGRNRGRNPWRRYPGGRSASSYIYLVIDSVVKNYHRDNHPSRREIVGIFDPRPDGRRACRADVAAVEWADLDAEAAVDAGLRARDRVAELRQLAATDSRARRLLDELESSAGVA